MDERTSSLVYLVAAGLVTALACGVGAIPVMFFHDQLGRLRPVLQGAAIGLMVAASVTGLLRPAWRSGGPASAAAGFLVGVLFFLATHWLMRGREVQVGDLRGKGVRKSVLIFAGLFIHSLPEGMAMG
jgi:ZIP family zinc transporter